MMKNKPLAPATIPENPSLKPFDSTKVVEFLGKARVEKINALCNGQFEPRLQQACKAAADLVQAVLLTLSACGIKPYAEELERMEQELEREAQAVHAKAEKAEKNKPAALPETAA